jgi:hypothetical protein
MLRWFWPIRLHRRLHVAFRMFRTQLLHLLLHLLWMIHAWIRMFRTQLLHLLWHLLWMIHAYVG